MQKLIIDFLDALIPLGIAGLLLLRPQAFTKRDLTLEENATLAGRLKIGGYVLLGAGILILISNLMTK